MFYQLHDLQRQCLQPVAAWAQSAAALFSSPLSPFSYLPFARRMAAGYDLLHRLGKRYDKPAFGLTRTTIDGAEVAVVEERVLVKPFCTLLHFARRLPRACAAHARDPRVLLVAPLSGHHATLLRDTVRALLPAHDVWITDWADARDVPPAAGPFHLDDYVDYAAEFIRRLAPDLHVVSVCQPTVPVLAAISLMASAGDPALPRTMTLMGGPIDARRNPTAVNALATTRPHAWFEDNLIFDVPAQYAGGGRRVYPGFLQQAGFVAMHPDRHLKSHWDYYLDLVKGDEEDAAAHRRFYDEYNAVLDLPAEYYLDTIRSVFQEYRLALGTWDVRGRRVAPQDIRSVALFTIEGELDDISGCGQTEAAHALCANLPKKMKRHLVAPGAGHYSIFSGRRWRELVCPQIAAFIRTHG